MHQTSKPAKLVNHPSWPANAAKVKRRLFRPKILLENVTLLAPRADQSCYSAGPPGERVKPATALYWLYKAVKFK